SINQNIYVKTAQGGDVITSLHQTQNDRITVMPHPDGYAPGDYTLYIEKGVRSTGGKTLKKAIKMEFTVTP
ncbi:MAG: hypothetical protein PHS52_08190, partial [Desulfotomaculaceae bacterium]|nr:hypothetical protein [Desulfotomaculaceae bacterium]